MSLRLKFNLIFGLTSLLGVLVSGFLAHHFLQQNAREEVLDRARVMLESARAVRGYTVDEIRPLLELQQKRQFLPQTVPAYSARKYINKLQEQHPNYSYKEATLNPTNPVDRAADWEVDIVNWFRNKPDVEELELVGERDTPIGRFMYLSQPIRITNEACLVCHSTPTNAPKTMIDSYGNANGFGWKLNEVVGAQIVSVPMSLSLQRAEAVSQVFMASMTAVFVLIGLLLNLLLHVVVIKPVKNMADNANRVSMGALDVAELEVKGKDEISSLAQSFNRMHHAQLEAQNERFGCDLTNAQSDSPPRVFVFRGESFDEPELEEEVRSRLRVLLQAQWKVREGDRVICSAQRGAEILFAEECVRLKANVRLMLPLSTAEFVNRSVRKTGADWEKRFYKLAKQCEVLEQPVRLGDTPAELDPYERNNVWCLEVARTELGPDVRPRVITLSIRGEDHPDSMNKAGSLKHFERCARNLDLLVERAVVWSVADEPTWFPTGNTVMHVHRPNGKTDTLSLEKELRLGRAGDNDVILGDRSISRHHLKLKPVAEGVQLKNVSGHPNATFLDGVALAPCSEKKPLLVTPEQTIKLVDGTQITFEALNRPA